MTFQLITARGVKEVIHRGFHPNNIDRNNGIKIPEARIPMIRKHNERGWYNSKLPGKQLGVRPLRKLELTGTMGIEIRHLHLIAVRQMVMREQSNPSPDDN